MFSANSSLIENTAHSCEEMHARNLLKLLPHTCFDPTHANDPFMFLFKSEKISVNIKSQTCEQMISTWSFFYNVNEPVNQYVNLGHGPGGVGWVI